MSDGMFGAPTGISAAEDQIRQNMLGGLQAQKALGEIAMQPAEAQLKEAHARLYGAEAAKAEAAAREQEGMAALMKGLPTESTPGETGSLADPLLRLGTLGLKSGYINTGTKLLTQGMSILSKEEQIRTAQSTQALKQFQLQREQLQQTGSLAASAIDQPSYDRMRQYLVAQGHNVSDLPEDFQSAQPILQQIVTSSMKAAEVLNAREAKARTDSLLARRRVQNAKDTAAIDTSKARVDVLRQRERILSQTDGPNAPSTVAANAEKNRERRVLSDLREARLYPTLTPLQVKDKAQRTVGQTYTLPTGRYVWSPEGWIAAPKGAPAASTAAAVAGDYTPATEGDEGEEE